MHRPWRSSRSVPGRPTGIHVAGATRRATRSGVD
jgi:hypothetical protein